MSDLPAMSLTGSQSNVRRDPVEKKKTFSSKIGVEEGGQVHMIIHSDTVLEIHISTAVQRVDADDYPTNGQKQQQKENKLELDATPQDRNADEELEMITKKARGRTMLANLTRRNGDLIKINWNMNGQPISDDSVQFASFVGILVKEIVPYTLSDWRKMTPMMRDILWASIQAKYDLHQDWEKNIINAKTDNKQQALKPDCIKSDVEWRRAFVKQETSKEHMALSRRGYTRTIDDMGQLDDIIRENPNSQTTNNIDEDALTMLFGIPKSGRHIGQGRGISKSKVAVVNMFQDKIEAYNKELGSMKKQIAELFNDPNIEVHGITLGSEFMQVWVDKDKVISPSAYFFRPSHPMITIQEAVGSFVVCPSEKLANHGMSLILLVANKSLSSSSY
ncbi:hypothetical protein F8388_023647 [Cannabis sativa]|uniref:Uncharacterized protein n=1 Tax=Cannabis sativa TaxID=3483 RepID=A0A7J6GBQ0_CANSA|nr:hypothetical protein F8388_023647 [Cannabis sativa]